MRISIPSLVLAAALAAPSAYAAPADAVQAAFALGDTVPYTFNQASVSCRDGLSGTARVYGVDLGGERYPLFETRLGYADSISFRYYAWPGLASLSFEGASGDGLAVAASVEPRFTETDPETAALSALGFPFRLTPWGPRRRAITTAWLAGSPEMAARRTLSELFAAGRRAAPLAMLASWTAASIAFMAWRRGDANEGKAAGYIVAAFALAACAASIAAYALGRAPAELYSVAIPGTPGPISDALPLRERTVAGADGCVSVSWDATGNADPGPRLMGIRSPLSAAVPVSAFDEYRRVRFASPPLVVRDADGALRLAPAPFISAWGMHE